MAGENCSDYFECNENVSLEQALREMIVKDANGCPVLKVKVSVSESAPDAEDLGTPEFVAGAGAGADAATALAAKLATWASSNKKVYQIMPYTDDDGKNGFILIPFA